jgi:hypothetical protein
MRMEVDRGQSAIQAQYTTQTAEADIGYRSGRIGPLLFSGELFVAIDTHRTTKGRAARF